MILIEDLKQFMGYFGLKKYYAFKLLFMRYFYVIVLIRLSLTKSLPLLPFRFASKVILSIVFGIEVASRSSIGKGLILPHPHNIILGGYSIGENCIIMSNVTIGAILPDPEYSPNKRPVNSDSCLLGVGSCILGGVTIGSKSTIGANSVITKSFDDNSTIVGSNRLLKRV